MPGGGSAEANNRWSGTQLGVGVLGRHRRCSIELAPHGILRLLAENSHLKNGSAKAPWIRLGNKFPSRTTVLHECWVEDLPHQVEAKPRKSKPDLNALHLWFPQQGTRQLPSVAQGPRQKGGGRAGAGDKADCQPRWQGAAGEPLLVRVTIDGGHEQEHELCSIINEAARRFAHQRAFLAGRLARLLDLRQTSFSDSNEEHMQELLHLWQLAMGDGIPAPPMTAPPVSASTGAAAAGSKALDWGDLGFQNRYCPQSDFRDMGMLSVHLLTYYAQNQREEVASLVQANRERDDGYPFAAAAINVGHLLIKLLLEGVDASGEAALRELQMCPTGAGTVGADEILSQGGEGLLRSPLFVVLSRVLREFERGESGAGESAVDDSVVEKVFCCAFGLLERLWVRHGATYMMFNRVLAALKECICVYLQDEWREPTGSLRPLRDFDVNRVQLSSGALSALPCADSRPSSQSLSADGRPSSQVTSPPPALDAGGGGGRKVQPPAPAKASQNGSNPDGSSSPMAQKAAVASDAEEGCRVAVHDEVDGGKTRSALDATVAGHAHAHAASDANARRLASGPASSPATRSPVASGDGGVTPRSPISPRAAARRMSLVSQESTSSLYGPEMAGHSSPDPVDGGYGPSANMGSYEGAYDIEGRFDRYAPAMLNGCVEGLEADEGVHNDGDHDGVSSAPDTPPSSDAESDHATHSEVAEIIAWSPTGNMV